jgi:hypothetical protein
MENSMNVRHVATAAVLSLFAVILSGCNGASTSANNPPSNANLEGTWEIVSTSTTNPGVSTVIDVTLNGVVGTNNSFTGRGVSFQSQPTFDPYDCQSVWIDNQNNPLTLTTTGSQVTGTFTDGSAVFNFTGQASGVGTTQAQFSGTYTSAAGNSTACQGSGTVIGTYIANLPVSLAGNYVGSSGYLTGTTLSVTQNGGSVTAVLSGAGTYSGADTLNVNTAIVSDGSDVLTLWWDGSSNTLWLWSQADGASGFTKQ